MRRDAPPDATDGSRRLAPLLRRCAALTYEGLVLAAIVLLLGFLTAPLVPGAEHGGSDFPVPTLAGRVLSAVVVFVVAGVYFAWSWTGGRRTLPMKTWRMSLTRADGRPVDARTALVRYLAAWIGPVLALAVYAALRPAGLGPHAVWLAALNYLWALVDPERQFLHDRVAGTRIVLSGSGDPPR